MTPLIKIQVPAHEGRLYINHCLRREGLSSALRRRLKNHGEMMVNGEVASWGTLLKEGDIVTVYLPPTQELEPYEMPLDILFEDEHLVAINKPAGLLMHPTSTERHETLANALAAYYSASNQKIDFHPIHRLDKDTSGIVLIAKNPMVQHEFTKQEEGMRKTYAAIVEGQFPLTDCAIHFPIARKEGSIMERECCVGGASAHTDMHCIAHNEKASVLYMTLHTGRTHQIRVHCATLGYPIIGDDMYGATMSLMERQALHAQTLAFTHPMTGERITLRTPLPKDMKRALWALDLLSLGHF